MISFMHMQKATLKMILFNWQLVEGGDEKWILNFLNKDGVKKNTWFLNQNLYFCDFQGLKLHLIKMLHAV